MRYKLSQEADYDLTAMYLYGFNRFGEEQAENYFYEIEECINLLADTPLMLPGAHSICPACKNSASCQSSYHLYYSGADPLKR